MKVCFLGNCQAEQISEIFKIIYPHIQVLDIPSVHLMPTDIGDSIDNTLIECDFVFSHFISNSFSVEHVRTERLRALLPERLKVITNIYSTHLNTDICHLTIGENNGRSRLQGPLDGIHLMSIWESFLDGLSIDDAISKYLSFDSFESRAIDDSFRELRRRDKEFSVDIPFADTFFTSSRIDEVLHTFHHPTIVTALKYAVHIGGIMDFGPPERLNISSMANTKASNSQIHVCPHPRCVDYIGAEYAPSTLFRAFPVEVNGPAGTARLIISSPRLMPLAQLITHFYSLYNSLDLNSESAVAVGRY